ncbi:MAG: hypothetical protein QM765_35500 [Myxococcales bacterium]
MKTRARKLTIAGIVGLFVYCLSFLPVLYLLQQAESAGVVEPGGTVEHAVFGFYAPILLLDRHPTTGAALERIVKAFGIH